MTTVDLTQPQLQQHPITHTSDLFRPRARPPPPSVSGDRRAFAITRRGVGVDLPGFGRRRSDMSDQEDDAPAARNARCGSRPRAGRVPARDDECGRRQWRRSEFPSADDPAWARCTVKSHEEFPRHIYRLFLLLCIQFRWILTRSTLARALVTPAELAIDNAKEAAWMEMYDHDRDTLEDILYRRLQDLWAPITDSMKVFDANGAAQPLCAQKVWEALLTAFPLDHNTCRLFCLLVKLLA
jgi:hypothetical protein